ncbi:hypothetical protein [Brevundimonas sp.]|uniref:hypothetical protein n=1 Tax=Brevundimonas sp. TaxID=1871086 RepID=UPI00391D2CF4
MSLQAQPPGAPPLTAAMMVDKAWSHLQAAVAAGRLIEARGWMRLYKDLKPYARHEEIEAREARLEREAAELREAAVQPGEDRLVIPQAPQTLSGIARLPLHSFSASESHARPPADDDPTGDLLRLTTRLAAVSQQIERAARAEDVGLSLHSFSAQESHTPPRADAGPTDDPAVDVVPKAFPVKEFARLLAEVQAVTALVDRRIHDETVRLPLHSFSRPESHHLGQGP